MQSFLGYSIAKEGILPKQGLIESISNVSTTISKKELDSFLGSVNFYIPKYSVGD